METNENDVRKEILGISQVVLGVRAVDKACGFLEPLGFQKKGRIDSAQNPPEKKEFIKGPMAPAHDLMLISSPSASPLIELVRPQFTDTFERADQKTNPPTFEIILGTPGTPSENYIMATILDGPGSDSEVPLKGIRLLADSKNSLGVIGFVIHCDAIEQTLFFWRTLGFEAKFLNVSCARIDVRGLMPGYNLSIFFVAGKNSTPPIEPDREGVICPTFLCKDVERLAPYLTSKGFQVGQSFEFSPFGPRVKVFFLRTANGDLYEFLSIS